MKYPLPRTILSYLASHGSAATQLEALRLLDLPIPAHFPTYAPGSKEWLLRRLASDKKRAAHARLAAMKELFFRESEQIDPAVAKLIGLHDAPHVAPLPPELVAPVDPQLDTPQESDEV
ncbi:MAG: hypothetical protein DMG48_02965 [Acidobacteria bacterium]|nr:MAG: hypothetical protein DMG48_02965 [Acidobacteriota bacterium]